MPCLFCQIVQEKIKAEIIYRDRYFVVFRDINPKARVHFLMVPKRHIASVNHLRARDIPLIGKMFLLVKKLAKEKKLVAGGYQLHFNVGAGAGQTIEHLHLHLLAN